MKIVVIVLVVMMVACGAGLYYCGKKVVDTAAEVSDQVTEEGVPASAASAGRSWTPPRRSPIR